MGEKTGEDIEREVQEMFTEDYSEQRESLSEDLSGNPVDTIYKIVSSPDNVSRHMRTVAYDEQGLQHFIDPRYRALYIGVRTSDVADDGTATFVLFQGWNKEVKRDPPSMKPTKTWYEEQTHATWARIFVEADREFESGEELREHVRSQMEYCEELDDDDYFELNSRLVGRTVDEGPYGDDLTREWVADKLPGEDYK